MKIVCVCVRACLIFFFCEHGFATFSAVQEETQLVWELAVIAERVQTGVWNTLQRRGKHREHIARVVETARVQTDVEHFVSLTCHTLETQNTPKTQHHHASPRCAVEERRRTNTGTWMNTSTSASVDEDEDTARPQCTGTIDNTPQDSTPHHTTSHDRKEAERM